MELFMLGFALAYICGQLIQPYKLVHRTKTGSLIKHIDTTKSL